MEAEKRQKKESAELPLEVRLARRINAVMALRGVNQMQLAKMTGQSTQTICKLCNGKSDFRFSTMRKIEIALQCILVLIPNEDLV